MGLGDSIAKTAKNAMEDLGGLSEPTDDGHVPDPGAPEEEIKVHSSISEGSNAADEPRGTDELPGQAAADGRNGSTVRGNGAFGDAGAARGSGDAGEAPDSNTFAPSRDVPGPGGLPDPDPDDLRADPSESDVDPSSGMGRG
ncbi:hypothetical protein [Arthrobacter sp. ok362]|jgi:hypothetical protein|uniref:hypothetical protein n=1 Tax=Arthrobacter sp. ok362 TaxID=1761745 RepID=UPI00087F292A|nr:hypothetical protein [Arthrobacter sp. ok362]SDL99767.1 hypothetical protein SAMN04487913_12018 [Arthrobacter sp. ok362]